MSKNTISVALIGLLVLGVSYTAAAQSMLSSPASSAALTNGSMESSCIYKYNQADVNYMTSMIEHHQGAIKMAEMVPQHTNRSEIVNLSTRVIEVQEREIENMEALLNESCILPTVDEDKHIAPTERQVNYLDSLNGTEFDLTFINMMAAHHTDAIMESRIVLRDGKSEQVKEIAQNVTGAQQKEIEQMYNWYLEWSED